MRLLQVLEGPDKGKFVVQKHIRADKWETLAICNTLQNAELEYRKVLCPFKDNYRVVNDQTFAVRFKKFLEGVQVCDAGSQEDLEYLKYVASKLLEYQKATVKPNSDEERYLKNCGVL